MLHRFARCLAPAAILVLTACGGDGPTGDTTPPRIVGTSPSTGATDVARATTISATFSEAMNAASVTTETFTVRTPLDNEVPGTVSVDGNVATFTPTFPLPSGMTLSARFSSAVEDLAGNTMSTSFTWSFTTIVNPPPTVLSVSPAADASGVDPHVSISATFSEPVVAPRIDSFYLVSNYGVTSGTVVANGSTLTLTPSTPLAAGTTYTVRLEPSIEDLEEGTLAARYTWSFTTALNVAPEHVAANVQVGVPVTGEAIEVAGDIDEFHLRGSAGAEWILFARNDAQDGIGVGINVRDSLSGAVIAQLTVGGPTVDIEERSTTRFTVPRAGPYIVRVFALEPTAYTFRIDAVNRTPETAPASYAIGDTTTEAIGTVGDIDEFTFQGTAGDEVGVSFQLPAAVADGLALDVYFGSTSVARISAATVSERFDDVASGRLTLPGTGTYTVRVSGVSYGKVARNTGTYRFTVYRIDHRPENGATIQLDGPPISGAIERPGDIDEYELTGTQGQLVVLRLSTTGTRGGDIAASLLGANGTVLTTAFTGISTSSDGGNEYSRRLALPSTGTYRIRVRELYGNTLSTGPYVLEAYTVSAAPEHVPSTITIGQTVTGESIDRPGDLDVFTFAGEAGRIVNLFLGWNEPDEEELWARISSSIFSPAGTLTLDARSTGRFTLKDSTYTLTVDPHFAAQSQTMRSAGAYAFRVFPIDSRPEGRAAAYTLGDTVSAEPLYPAGDIDDYTFELADQTTVDIFWDASASGPVWAILWPEGSTTSVWSNFGTVDGQFPRRITLVPGRYRLNVLNQNIQAPSEPFGPKAATLTYRFAFVPRSSP